MSDDFLAFSYSDDPLELYPWMTSGDFQFKLVTPDNIAECIDACINGVNGLFSCDLECTGLDNRVFDGETVAKMVGVCLSGDGKTGWYIPLRHRYKVSEGVYEDSPHNIPFMLFDREFRRLMTAVDEGKVRAIFHNGKFDQEFLEYNGGEPYGDWSSPNKWEDTLILTYLRNSRAMRKGLKEVAEAEPNADPNSPVGGPGLGMKMLELSQLFPKDHPKDQYDFSLLDPSAEGPLIYACSDGICTWLLYPLLAPAVLNPAHGFDQARIYKIEKSAVAACRWMERNRIATNPEKVMELVHLGQQEWFDSIMDVYASAQEILGRDVMPGYYKVLRDDWVSDDPQNLLRDQLDLAKRRADIRGYGNPIGRAEAHGQEWPLIYDVNAPQQLGQMFDEMRVPGLQRTEASNQIKTSKDVLEKVIEAAEAQFPFMKKIKRFREVNKALTSYLFPMLEDVDPRDYTMRISFNGHKTDTGRYSTPSKRKVKIQGWPEINFQSIPATYDPNRPQCMTRIRECVVARPGYKIVAIDFSGEELRLVTNLSREPKWLEEFFRCSGCARTFYRGDGSNTPSPPPPRCPNCGSDKIGDLHTLTALEIYGQDAPARPDWKMLRGNAKGTNFGLCYGGGGNAVVRATGCDKNEGWRVKTQFDATYSGLKRWWEQMHGFAAKYGFVLTAFNRVYPVPDVWSSDNGFRSKALRNAVNGPIQGSGADIIKMAMALCFRECKKRGWLDKCRMIATMHDELVFEIHDSILFEAIQVMTTTMTSNDLIKAQKWPVPLTTDCEIGYDWTVPWDLNGMTYREVRYNGDKKVYPPKAPDAKKFASVSEYEAALQAFPAKMAEWEAMPHSFPASLRSLPNAPPNLNAGGSSPAPTSTTAPERPSPDSPAVPVNEPVEISPAGAVEIQDVGPTEVVPPATVKNSEGEFVFTLKADLTILTCTRLAEVIHKCQGRGSAKLKILAKDGTLLPNWSDKDVLVNGVQFFYLADEKGLC